MALSDEKDFNLWVRVLDVFAGSMGFLIALSMNDAFGQTFKLIPLKLVKYEAGQAWIYAAVILVLGMGLIVGIFYLQRYITSTEDTS